jgi:hypothetical protein
MLDDEQPGRLAHSKGCSLCVVQPSSDPTLLRCADLTGGRPNAEVPAKTAAKMTASTPHARPAPQPVNPAAGLTQPSQNSLHSSIFASGLMVVAFGQWCCNLPAQTPRYSARNWAALLRACEGGAGDSGDESRPYVARHVKLDWNRAAHWSSRAR